MMNPLIFYSRSLSWTQVREPQPWDTTALPSVSVWSAATLRSFPMPGRPEPMALDDVVITSEGLCFPRFGPFYVQGAFGAFKALLIDPAASTEDRVLLLGSFIRNAPGIRQLTLTCAVSTETSTGFSPQDPRSKLFHSDQPVVCGARNSRMSWHIPCGIWALEREWVSFRNNERRT